MIPQFVLGDTIFLTHYKINLQHTVKTSPISFVFVKYKTCSSYIFFVKPLSIKFSHVFSIGAETSLLSFKELFSFFWEKLNYFWKSLGDNIKWKDRFFYPHVCVLSDSLSSLWMWCSFYFNLIALSVPQAQPALPINNPKQTAVSLLV